MKIKFPKPNKYLFPLVLIASIIMTLMTNPIEFFQSEGPQISNMAALYFIISGIVIALVGFDTPKSDDNV